MVLSPTRKPPTSSSASFYTTRTSSVIEEKNLTLDWVGPDVCNYTYVFCAQALDNPKIRTVVGIDLNHDDIVGYVPEELDLLTNLALLHINTIRFCGTVPHKFGKLKLLFELDLSNNRFAGKSSLGTVCWKIVQYVLFQTQDNHRWNMELISNQILPKIVGSSATSATMTLASPSSTPLTLFLPSLEPRYASEHCSLSNLPQPLPLPEALLTRRAKSVNSGSLANNRFHGCMPAVIDNMKGLNEIILMKNAFKSCFPEEIGLLKNLTVFDVSFKLLYSPLYFPCSPPPPPSMYSPPPPVYSPPPPPLVYSLPPHQESTTLEAMRKRRMIEKKEKDEEKLKQKWEEKRKSVRDVVVGCRHRSRGDLDAHSRRSCWWGKLRKAAFEGQVERESAEKQVEIEVGEADVEAVGEEDVEAVGEAEVQTVAPEIEVEVEVVGDVEAMVEVQTEAMIDVQPQTETVVDVQSQVEPELHVAGEVEVEVDVVSDVEVVVELQTKAVIDVQPEGEVEVEDDGVETQGEVESESNVEGNMHVGVNVDGQSDVEGQVEVEGEVEGNGVQGQRQGDVEAYDHLQHKFKSDLELTLCLG
ncbi:hypothetical protein LR48_Vigan10g206600 [Vigna angularis]|uniref:Leucine-rich repeat-containing N-terminal plant-type domain-containing protein n=1 Tax=Phaseolus angularis TaxID=3914 RepID=A0A0L9VN49_PHAAN|nr:hypothetical protein LR48_Vigan10g206600 [Vigna angularis]